MLRRLGFDQGHDTRFDNAHVIVWQRTANVAP
jgi:hypothetical protein